MDEHAQECVPLSETAETNVGEEAASVCQATYHEGDDATPDRYLGYCFVHAGDLLEATHDRIREELIPWALGMEPLESRHKADDVFGDVTPYRRGRNSPAEG